MFIYGDLNNTTKYIVMRSYFYFIDGRWRNKSKYTAPPRTNEKYSVADPGGDAHHTGSAFRHILQPLQKDVVRIVVPNYILYLKTI